MKWQHENSVRAEEPRRGVSKHLFAPSLVLVFTCLASACARDTTEPAAPPAVSVAHPTTQSVTDAFEFTGNTAASQSVTLVARVEGYLEGIHFSDGADVHGGDLLFTIQPDQYQAQLKQAEAQVAAEKAAVEHATTELGRYTELVKHDSAPQTQVDRWEYERDSSLAALHGAEAQVDLAKLNLGYTRVTAPLDGRIGRHLVDVGNLVGGVGQAKDLAEINQIDPLYVYFTIDERAVLALLAERSAGHMPAAIPAAFGLLEENGYPHPGQVDFASLSVAPRTGTLQVRGTFPNPAPGVPPGLFARVRIPKGPPRDALVIPGDAISFDQQGAYVLIVNANDVVERRAITTGTQVGDQYVVESGLRADDWIVVAGLARAIPGRKVSPDRSAATAMPTPLMPTPSPAPPA